MYDFVDYILEYIDRYLYILLIIVNLTYGSCILFIPSIFDRIVTRNGMVTDKHNIIPSNPIPYFLFFM